ncbi:carotenoid ester lipase precursor [Irpex rosettiformis]|uniref:Carotenoid ester lipase n=1 Tax=Irpex rosettiformis TaxID=378272 RepID=A0ACB8TQN6_9APHY|nr:carotenoid ester lipase precursor [Irpex rosettiformis]
MFIRISPTWIAAAATLCYTPVFAANNPQVQLDQGVFTGINNGTTNRFLGIPFAKPPTGDLRFRLPVANDPYTGVVNATAFGPACPQQTLQYTIPDNLAPEAKAVLAATSGSLPDAEDCLTINIWQPSDVAEGTKLPVVIWIFGGIFDGSVIVQRSIEMNQPIIYASINHSYVLLAFGFLGGAQVKAAGVANLGLRDQRQAFRWVQKYISAFGGDPTKVTIWGQSSGAISVGLHMVANGGDNENLFRAGFMQSGSQIPYGDVENGQWSYNQLVGNVGCQNASDSLQCLREVPYDALKAAMNASPSILSRQALNSSWVPRADGVFLVDPSQQAVLKGTVANIPFVSGNCDDEGTLFALSQTDITTNNGTREYISSNYLSNATEAEIDRVLAVYPDDIAQGSPFDTGSENALTPEYKRLAAFQGDLIFIGTRRFLLQHRSDKQPAWSFLSKRSKSTPDLGSFHGHDVPLVYGPSDLTDYLVNFVNHLDPNGNGSMEWPRYTPSSPALMTFLDGDTPQTITQDTFREDAIGNLTELFLKYPL